jgi:hypothetical protein
VEKGLLARRFPLDLGAAARRQFATSKMVNMAGRYG